MHPAVNSLTAPSQHRQGIMLGGILQIMVGRGCDRACFGCTQGSNLAGKAPWMSVDQFDEACVSLDGYFGVVGLFGGNCCLHPRFEDLCRIMQAHFPRAQRGIWTNNLNGHGAICRQTFDPAHSNLNTHMDQEAAEEIRRDWPEAARYIKGDHLDSLHGTPWVSMTDLGIPEEERWKLIAGCDISKHWSAILMVSRGELRAFFCEVAGAMASLHQDNPDWAGTGQPFPDVGLALSPGWWKKPMAEFEQQVNTCCHHCAVPLRRPGQLAIMGSHEEFSETHRSIARPKVRDRAVQFISSESLVRSERPATDYLPGTTPRQS
jgi:hypothetical protein